VIELIDADRQIKGDLERFKEFVESRGAVDERAELERRGPTARFAAGSIE
jgi:hypothetical protein